MKRSDFRGTGKVFKFTLAQHYKSKSTLVTLAIFFVTALLSMPIISAVGGGASGAEMDGGYDTAAIYLYNETRFPLDAESFTSYDPAFNGIEFTACTEEPDDELENAVYLHTSEDNVDGKFVINGEALSENGVGESEIYSICSAAGQILKQRMLALHGVTDMQLDILYKGSSVSADQLSAFLSSETEVGSDGYFLVSYVLSMLVMMLTMFSSIYIIQAVVEEKSSKLVELLMVSIEPLALILGKILAVMCFIFAGLLLVVSGFVISFVLSSVFMNAGSLSSLMPFDGVSSVVAVLNPADVVIFLISMILGYSSFALMGGLSGARCANLEDAGSANLSVTLIAVFCYMAAVMQSTIDSAGFTLFAALCPMLSIFCAPASYICGRIELWVLILSWVLQAGVIVGIAALSARVYRNLIIYSGNRVKFKALIKMAQEAKQ